MHAICIFEACRILSNKFAITSHHAFIMLPHSHCSVFTITTYDRSYQFSSFCHAACLALVIVRAFVHSFVRSFDRSSSSRHCVFYASKQCDCGAVSRTLFLGAPVINACNNVGCNCIYLRSICRLLSFPSSQLYPLPWLVTMRAMLHGYKMAYCCNIHGKSLPSILMAVYFGSGLCSMPICNGKIWKLNF